MVISVGISLTQIAQYYPKLYHMAEENTWDSIRKNGLLSTAALLNLYEVNGTNRFSIESEHRPEAITINHKTYGSAVIRDQKPMREAALEKCLTGLNPRVWYEILNSKVFFWLTEERLLNLLSAKEYKDRTHCVLIVDTAQLLERYADHVKLSPMNSGSTLYKPQPRGIDTFLAPNDYPFDTRRKLRGVKNAIAELTVEYSVPDIEELTIKVAHMRGSRTVETIYER
jgi:hypothetical protein